ncbi:MAG: RsmB/NOP family class I SAM-dependent RNA methyltransferase [SAR324 cluster bacterium]|nr:RsmB/NOP family class I SAM-dependent RNA methyltransferase [SAR324 cluster bacterium]
MPIDRPSSQNKGDQPVAPTDASPPVTNRQQAIILRQIQLCEIALERAWNACLRDLPADQELQHFFRGHRELGARDRRLIQQVVFGVFRWWGWISRIKEAFVSSRSILLALILDETPWNALCEELAIRHSLQPMPENWQIAGSLSEKQQWLSAWLPLDPELLSPVRLLPDWFASGLPEVAQNIAVQQELLTMLQSRPPMWLRFQGNRYHAAMTEIQKNAGVVSTHPGVPKALGFKSRINLKELDSYRQGHLEVQDLASQCVGLLCCPASGEKWWDVCAGGGGKALHLADLMAGKGQVWASEIREQKISEIKKRVSRGPWSCIRANAWDGTQVPANFPQEFDGVLVDAPCSCTGTWRRNPDLRWRTRLEQINALVETQNSVLRLASNRVKSGGKLIYATCSMMFAENTGVVQKFLTEHPDFNLSPVAHPLTGRHTSGEVWLWPQEADCDGMYVACMTRMIR